LQVDRSASQHVCLTMHYIYWILCKRPAMYGEPSGVTCDPLGTPAADPCMHNIACLQLLNGIITALLLKCCECNRVSMYNHAEQTCEVFQCVSHQSSLCDVLFCMLSSWMLLLTSSLQTFIARFAKAAHARARRQCASACLVIACNEA